MADLPRDVAASPTARQPSVNDYQSSVDPEQGPVVVVQEDTPLLSPGSPSFHRPQLDSRGFGGSFRWSLAPSITQPDPVGSRRNLGTFAGVFCPVALSMFSTVLFLRLGFVVGQAGIIEAVVQFILAYFILILTILSICAISTNGAVEGGGAYYMISRALGPEFGGSIGFLFFLANVLACALYISGFVEGLISNFGQGGSLIPSGSGIPSTGHWWPYLYATGILLFCLLVCLVGGAMFARTSIFILLIVVICTLSVILSVFINNGPMAVCVPDLYKCHNVTSSNDTCHSKPWYTGLSNGSTFRNNLLSHYSKDNNCKMMTFATVFAVLFSSVTGIMNGANMSGELKEPGKSIPKGTLAAACFTFLTYIILAFLVAASSKRPLLLHNYVFMQEVNVWPPFVVIGIFAATLSAALGNLIGASRILEALAKDELFWFLLRPATIVSRGGNPYVAVLMTWALVQGVLLIGSLNAIAPLTSVFFLLSYAATNLACLGLDVASAPNFRPTFKYFSWYTSALGLVGCIIMCFLIDPIYASVSIIVCMILVIMLHLRSLPSSWGSISQALIFHQVRKYLLLLDSRKDHVKFWRPQMLLLVSNPRSCCELIQFVNDIKKSGLYVLGHVTVGNFDVESVDPCQVDNIRWQGLVSYLKVKAFVELTLAKSVREGLHHLIRISGLGGMKPNTICLGFYDNSRPQDSFSKLRQKNNNGRSRVRLYGVVNEDDEAFFDQFPDVRGLGKENRISAEEYVTIVFDALKMQKNVCLCRHFHNLNKNEIVKSKTPTFIDVWPVNMFKPESASYFDNTCLFLLQLACILNMVPGWKSNTILRVFLCVDAQSDDTLNKERKLDQLLGQLRIRAQVKIVTWEHVTCLLDHSATESDRDAIIPAYESIPDAYIHGMNELIKVQCENTSAVFCYLPVPPVHTSEYTNYLLQLDKLTADLPPTVLVHGIHPVTSTTL